MGYDISAKFNTTAERDAMLDFLEKEKYLLKIIFKLDQHTAFNLTNQVMKGEDLGAYAPDKHRPTLIGLHGSGIPYSNWALCAWMNVKSGCLKKGKNFIFYDDEIEWVEVVKPGDLEGLKTLNFVVNSSGVAIPRLRQTQGLFGKTVELITKLNKENFKTHQQIAEHMEILEEKYQVYLSASANMLASKSKKIKKVKN